MKSDIEPVKQPISPLQQLSLESKCNKEVQTSSLSLGSFNKRSQRGNKRRYAAFTLDAPEVTWGAIKRLCNNAEAVVNIQGLPLTTCNFFMALLTLLSVQVNANTTYWAYFPDPPILHAVTWKDSAVTVSSSLPELIDGIKGIQNYGQFVINRNYTFKGQTNLPPICFYVKKYSLDKGKNGCLPVSDFGLLTDSPKEPSGKDKTTRHLWSLIGKFVDSGIRGELKIHPSKYPDCDIKPDKAIDEWRGIDINVGFPSWVYCMHNTEAKIVIPGSKYYVSDWSMDKPDSDYRQYLQHVIRYNWKDSLIPSPLRINRWNSFGWIAPMYTFNHKNNVYIQPQLWRLLLAVGNVTLKRPNAKENVYYVQTCVMSPYVLLLTNEFDNLQIVRKYHRFHVLCTECMLTTCIIPNMKVQIIMLLKKPAYIMLPVTLEESWYSDKGVKVIKRVSKLMRPKRFVATLILGISALIGIVSSFSLAMYTLVKEVQTAQYINDLSKNISLALATQEVIDRKLENKVDALEEAVLHIGQELTALKIRLSFTCHAKFSWVCVTPLIVNESEYTWEKIQMHILNVWNSSDIGIDLNKLHQQIHDIASSQLNINPSKIAEEMFQNMRIFFKRILLPIC